MPRRVKIAAWLAFGLHGILILTARYRLSYDAYNHMFFADHYRQDWWSLWEPRWYTGFDVTSYPPLVHQLIGLLGHLVGVDAAFALILWGTLTAFPIAIYCFSRIFLGQVATGYAAYGAALLPSLLLTGHVFGQLPTLCATLLALFAAAALADFLQRGGALTGALTACLFATVIAAHHATLLFLPFLVGMVALNHVIASHHRRSFDGVAISAPLRLVILRLATIATISIAAGWLVVFPFWEWGVGQAMQTSIDHASRHSFILDPFAAVIFFLPMYGFFILLIPLALRLGLQKGFLGAGLAFSVLFMLGLGGTTPLPRLFFGPGWTWLTYDRFAFWASLILLILFGALFILIRRTPPAWIGSRLTGPQARKRIEKAFLSALLFAALLIGLIPTWLPTQPPHLDMQPIVDFLAQADRAQWRYITFGFGDQFARLSRLTEATTIDGSYHTARNLPELRASGIGQIDTAYWIPDGLNALDPILRQSGEHGVRWAFVNLRFYDPVLARNGWVKIATLDNHVQVWENPKAILPPAVTPPVKAPVVSFAWGTFPLSAFFLSGALALRRYRPIAAGRVLSAVQALATGLLPLGLVFWYYRDVFVIEHARIYFTYSNALVFLSDGLALVAVLAWLIREPPSLRITPRLSNYFLEPTGWMFTLCTLASLSVLWSLDAHTALYVSLHFWLVFGLYLALRATPGAWHWFMLGCCAALVIQVLVGANQFIVQSTESTMAFGLNWPGLLTPALKGASVIQLADGTRWLRAYGTLPHPNLLGGFTLVLLAAPLALFLARSKRTVLALPLFAAGIALLIITFSRSAWLGCAAFASVLLLHFRHMDRKRLIVLGMTGALCILLLLAPLRSLFLTRLGESQAQTEAASNYTRLWLLQRTWEVIQQNPILGVGIGSYPLALSQHVAAFYDIEPVHNILLLATSELGIGGALALVGLFSMIAIKIPKVRTLNAIVLSGLLLGLLVAGLFDHYLWALAPGRLLLGTALGLWSGEMRTYDDHR